MAGDKVRLGGMALPNGVLVHGPTSWGAAVRLPDGTVKVVSARKRVLGANVKSPLLRGPLKLLDAFAVLPQVKRALPEAKLPVERPGVIGAMVASTVAVRAVRGSRDLAPLAQELASGLLSIAPATSRSDPTSTANDGRRSTSAAART
jgi:hypothetical protein